MKFSQIIPAFTLSLASLGAPLLVTTSAAAQDNSLNILCSVELEWCQLMRITFEKDTGIKVNMLRKSTGEVLAQLNAEKQNPKTDVWFGGTADPHMQAAQTDLTLAYVPALPPSNKTGQSVWPKPRATKPRPCI